MIDFETLPNSARRIRIERGLSLYKLSKMTGIAYSNFHQFELKGNGLSTERQYLYASKLGVDITDLRRPGKVFSKNMFDRVKSA